MGIFERVQETRRRNHPLKGGAVDRSDFAWGVDQEEFRPVEYGNYIATSNAVYACASLRADLISSLPIMAMRELEVVTTGKLRALLNKVNPFWSFNRLMRMTELSLCLWGQAFWIFDRGSGGAPREIWWAKPTQMRPVPDPVNYIKGFLYSPVGGGPDIPFAPEEVLWLRYPNPLNEYSGLSPIAAARLAADTESSMGKSNKNLFSQGLQMGGAVMPTQDKILSDEQKTEIEDTLQRRFAGADKAHKWAVFKGEFKLEQFGVTPKDAEFIQGLRWSLNAVCRAFRIPPELLGDQSRTYQNFPTALRAIWELALKPEAQFIATELTEQIVPMFGSEADSVAFDFSEVREIQHAATPIWERSVNALRIGGIGLEQFAELVGIEFRPEDLRLLPTNAVVGKAKERPAVPAPAPKTDGGDEEPRANHEDGNGKVDSALLESALAALDRPVLVNVEPANPKKKVNILRDKSGRMQGVEVENAD